MSNPMNLKPGRILNFTGNGLSAGLYSGVASPPQYTCPCGNPASNVCENNLLCSGCFFKYSVAKAAGRLEEFWDARKKEAEEKAAVALQQQKQWLEAYGKAWAIQKTQTMQQNGQAQSQIDNWAQQMQNFYPGALIPSDDPSGSVQKPEDPMPDKGWWKKFAEWQAKQK
jgi:hypothetical protein